MTTMKIPVIALFGLTLSACDVEPVPEGAELGLDTVSEPVVTQATMRAPLEGMVGEGVSGEVVVTPSPDSVSFHIDLEGAAPETTYGVRVQPGTCADPGAAVAVLESVVTGALGNGSSQGSVAADAHQVLDGRHVVGVFAPGAEPEDNRPLACAQLQAVQ